MATPPATTSPAETVGVIFGFGRKVRIWWAAACIALLGIVFSVIEALQMSYDGISMLYELPDFLVYLLLLCGLLVRKPVLIQIFFLAYVIWISYAAYRLMRKQQNISRSIAATGEESPQLVLGVLEEI